MRDSTTLGLHESILLLTLRDETGKTVGSTWWRHALSGAIITELVSAGRIEIETGKKSFINVIDARQTGDVALDACLKKISSAKRRSQAPAWISRLANMRDLKHDVARSLCDKGVLMEDASRVLIFFKQKVYPEINHAPERDLIRRINDAALSASSKPEPWISALIAVAQAGELLKTMMDRQNWKLAKDRLDSIMENDRVGSLTHDAVKAAQAAAVMAATSGSSVATMG